MADRGIGFTPNELALNSERTRTMPLGTNKPSLGESASEIALRTGEDPFVVLEQMQRARVDRFLALISEAGGVVTSR